MNILFFYMCFSSSLSNFYTLKQKNAFFAFLCQKKVENCLVLSAFLAFDFLLDLLSVIDFTKKISYTK